MAFEWWDNKKQKREVLTQVAEASQKYKKVFSSLDGKWVLDDLARRSCDRVTIYDPDEFKRGMNEGRRSLFNYIRSMVEKDLKDIQEELTK